MSPAHLHYLSLSLEFFWSFFCLLSKLFFFSSLLMPTPLPTSHVHHYGFMHCLFLPYT